MENSWDDSTSAIPCPELAQLTMPCKNCHATGTIFKGKSLKVGNSTKCPVCKGSCKVPYEGKQP